MKTPIIRYRDREVNLGEAYGIKLSNASLARLPSDKALFAFSEAKNVYARIQL
jgi:hypothetical protein